MRIRDAVNPIADADAQVGGPTAIDMDTRTTSISDRTLIIPVVLLVVFVILVLLLRSLVAPALLLGATVLSFATTLGVAAVLFNGPFGFPGSDPVVPLFAFVTFSALAVIPFLFLVQVAFLVALGVLVDALVVRTLLVPALTLDMGRRIWWPSALSRRAEPESSTNHRSPPDLPV